MAGILVLDNAVVLRCAVTLKNPCIMAASKWIDLVDEAEAAEGDDAILNFRTALISAGHDGLHITAWDGKAIDRWGREPCCEYDALTVCVFDHAFPQILSRLPPGSGWLPSIGYTGQSDGIETIVASPHLHPGLHEAMRLPHDGLCLEAEASGGRRLS